jgi:protease-4
MTYKTDDNQETIQPASTSPKPRKKRIWPWIAGAGVVLVALWGLGACALVGIVSGARNERTSWSPGDAVGMIYIEGPIGIRSSSPGGSVNSEEILDFIRQAESNPRVKAIIVFINSPGGAVVPSDEMYRALRDATKPVVAAMGDVAASGGYYIACGADKILAHPATITGSIGVYGQVINAADLLEKLGIEGIIIRSGDSKAIGNWFEHPTEEQLAIEQAIVDELYDLFVRAVAAGRDMDEERVRELADGRPFTGQQALDVGLVDALGSLSDAIEEAARMGKIEGTPQIIEYKRTPSLIELWLGAQRARRGDPLLQEWLDTFSLPQMRYIGP